MNNNLKQIRKIKGVTQKALADHLEVSKAMISMWENNPNERIPQDRIKQIAEYLRVEEKHIFTDELDVEALEKNAIKEEMEDLAERYAEVYEAEQIQRIREVDSHYGVISDELSQMINEPDKLEQVKRFCQAVNEIDLDTFFSKKIKPVGFENLFNRLLTLVEERDTFKLIILFQVVEYLTLLNEKRELNKENIFDDDKFFIAFDDFMNHLNLKKTGGEIDGTTK